MSCNTICTIQLLERKRARIAELLSLRVFLVCQKWQKNEVFLTKMAEYIKKTVITNSYGEVISEKESRYKGYFDEDDGYLFWNKRNSLKSWQCVSYPDDMTDSDIGKFTRLSKLIEHRTNALDTTTNSGIINTIVCILSCSERSAYRFFNKCLNNKMLAMEDSIVYVNPIYYLSGNRIDYKLYKIFQSELDKVLPEYVISNFSILEDTKE